MLTNPETDDEGVYHAYALRYARQLGRKAFENFLPGAMAGSDAHDGPMPVSYYIWILHNRFRTIVVDTGISPRMSVERRRELDIDPIEALARMGIDPDAVEDVILTHLHYDHSSNLHRFGKARLHVQEAEAAYVTGRCMCEPFMRAPFDIEDVVTLCAPPLRGPCGLPRRGYRAISRDITACVARPQSRHPGRACDDAPRAGAAGVRCFPFLREFPSGTPVPRHSRCEGNTESYWKLKQIAGSTDRIIPGHDPKVRLLYPKQEINGVELIVLHEPPVSHTTEDLLRCDPE